MRHRSPLLCLVAAVAALSLARPAFAMFAGGGGIKEGDPAPMFSGLTIDNQKIDFAQLKGKKVVVLDYWSIYCASCIEEMPRLVELHNEFKDKGLLMLGVNLDGRELKKAIDKFVVTEKIDFRIVFDELAADAFTVADPYGVAGTPALFLIDKKGFVAFSHVGAVTGEQLKAEIEKIAK